MKSRDAIVPSPVTVTARDDGREAARLVMLSTGIIFALIFVLQAMSP